MLTCVFDVYRFVMAWPTVSVKKDRSFYTLCCESTLHEVRSTGFQLHKVIVPGPVWTARALRLCLGYRVQVAQDLKLAFGFGLSDRIRAGKKSWALWGNPSS